MDTSPQPIQPPVNMDSVKRCTKCGEEYALSRFALDRSRSDGRHPWCRTCKKQAHDAHYPEVRKLAQQRAAAWARAHLAKRNAIVRRSHRKNRFAMRHRVYKYRGISISLEDYTRLFEQQRGCCAICERPWVEGTKALCLDHDHVTMKVRGMLCDQCNRGLGDFRDSPASLRRAAQYLEDHK